MINNLILIIIIIYIIIIISILIFLKEILKEYKNNFKIIRESLFDLWKEVVRISDNQTRILKSTIEVIENINKEIENIKNNKKM